MEVGSPCLLERLPRPMSRMALNLCTMLAPLSHARFPKTHHISAGSISPYGEPIVNVLT
jgi:hypothetical protein